MDAINWHLVFMALSGVFAITAIYPYIKDILAGETKPNAVSYFLWTLLEGIAFVAQAKAEEGTSLSIVVVGITVFYTGTIFVFSLFKKYGYREYAWSDAICLAICFIAVAAWQMTGDENLGILYSIVADVFACIPTIRKVWSEPRTEHAGGWLHVSISMAFGAAATDIYTFANLAFPVYMALMTLSVLLLILVRRKMLRA